MPSSYTLNLGIEKIGSGEQAGTWGTTTNLNFDIIDRAVNGVQAISLSGTTTTLTTTNGVLSEGGAKVLVLGGSPSGTNTITIDPSGADKMYFVHNNSGQTATFQQGDGSGGTVSIPTGSKGLIFADGAGTGAKVTDLLDGFSFGGTKVNSTAAELNIVDGGTSATATTIADADRLIVNDDGTMVQAAVTDLSTYVNKNLVEAKSALTVSGTVTVTPGGPTSVYQPLTVSSGSQTVRVAITNLVVGQYVIIDKTTTANSMTIDWTNNGAVTSNGISLGSSAELGIGIYNGTGFSFTETVKF
tara:strand:- start:116 stop:1018 length:903 start_codon:yes stop_codon:yes gene_type:complete